MKATHVVSIRTYLTLLAEISQVINEFQNGGIMEVSVNGESCVSCDIMKDTAEDIIALLRGEKLLIRKRLRDLYGIVIE